MQSWVVGSREMLSLVPVRELNMLYFGELKQNWNSQDGSHNVH